MIDSTDVKRLKQLRTQARKGSITHASQLSESDRETMRKALTHHITNGTATAKMLQLSKIHGISV